jgi:hypothetical protein
MTSEFKNRLENLLNEYSMENGSDTPDFILAEYLIKCLENFDHIVSWRERWYGRGEDFCNSVGLHISNNRQEKERDDE